MQLNDYFFRIAAAKLEKSEYQIELIFFYHNLLQFQKHLGTKIFDEYLPQKLLEEQFLNFETARNWFSSLCSLLLEGIHSGSLSDAQTKVQRICAFIEKEYANKDLSIQFIGDFFHISASYFSKIFKQFSGTSFPKFLNQTRINKAKVLLRNTAFKVGEVAQAVGFRDYRYFSSRFKKQTGISPLTYKKYQN